MSKTLSALAVMVLAVPAAFCQQRTPPTPAAMVAREVQHLTTLLDLTPGQVTTATMAFTDAATANEPLESMLRADRKQLEADVESGSPNIGADATAIGVVEGQILANRSAAEQTFWKSLMADQQTKFKQLGRGGFGPGPGGPGGPGGFGGRP
jgi:hypothetical protein